jgi:CheY-like chemotaxis protein
VPVVHANAARLSQVFLNLVLNAAQAFDCEDRERNRIVVRLEDDHDGHVLVSVADNGTGIRKQHLARIFEPFFTTKAAGKGTGLGLAITHSIVESMGGDIWVDSTVDEGTTFTVRIPVGVGPLEPAKTEPAPRPAPRARILIVDDERSLARALASVFSEHHDVTVSSDPTEALNSLLEGEPYDAVVCDLLMPRLSGMELFERATAQRPEYESRFVFITGGATTPEAARFTAEQRHRVLAKPFDPDALLSAVAERLR